MRIIVTGGSGFLGTHMIRALKNEGHEVKNIDLRPSRDNDVNTIIADIRNTDLMKQHIKDAEVVFHFAGLIEAGESVKFPQKYVDTNISGTISVLEAMRVNNIKTIIFSSSAAVYGEPLNIPIKEDDRTIPINPYGMNKLAMEGLISSYVEAHKFTGVALRYFNLYGPEEHHMPESHAMPRFIKQIFNNQEVTVYGNGEHKRDYIHIRDIVSAHFKALDYAIKNPEKYHYFNLSTEKPSTVLEIAREVEKAMNKQAKITYLAERPGDPLVLYANAQKARQYLGWQAQVSLEDGVKETVDYFLKYWEK
ncbi:MAG: NAD-dependent epimerase/dehydratase family protein [Pseudomonadales bacterium]|nr:NAD-dependent epimerase/dehydratase family protein [Pseudomonadales bacterium]